MAFLAPLAGAVAGTVVNFALGRLLSSGGGQVVAQTATKESAENLQKFLDIMKVDYAKIVGIEIRAAFLNQSFQDIKTDTETAYRLWSIYQNSLYGVNVAPSVSDLDHAVASINQAFSRFKQQCDAFQSEQSPDPNLVDTLISAYKSISNVTVLVLAERVRNSQMAMVTLHEALIEFHQYSVKLIILEDRVVKDFNTKLQNVHLHQNQPPDWLNWEQAKQRYDSERATFIQLFHESEEKVGALMSHASDLLIADKGSILGSFLSMSEEVFDAASPQYLDRLFAENGWMALMEPFIKGIRYRLSAHLKGPFDNTNRALHYDVTTKELSEVFLGELLPPLLFELAKENKPHIFRYLISKIPESKKKDLGSSLGNYMMIGFEKNNPSVVKVMADLFCQLGDEATHEIDSKFGGRLHRVAGETFIKWTSQPSDSIRQEAIESLRKLLRQKVERYLKLRATEGSQIGFDRFFYDNCWGIALKQSDLDNIDSETFHSLLYDLVRHGDPKILINLHKRLPPNEKGPFKESALKAAYGLGTYDDLKNM